MAIQKSENKTQINELIANLIVNFSNILELLHPFMPFITEELSTKLALLCKKEKSEFLVQSGFTDIGSINKKSEHQLNGIIDIVTAIRVIRAENPSIKNEVLHLIISTDMSSEMQSLIAEQESIISVSYTHLTLPTI